LGYLRWISSDVYDDEEFAKAIDRHRDAIAGCCKPENKVSLGFVEGLHDKIRVLQRLPAGYAMERIYT